MSLNSLTSVLARLTPPPFVNPVDYDGLEFRWRFLVFRPAFFQVEVYLIGALLLYGLWVTLGKSANRRKVDAWVSTYTPLLSAQFSKPLVNGITADGYSDFFTFSTGRRNIQSLHTIFTLKPRHDFFQYVYHILWSLVIDVQYSAIDDLQLDFNLAPNAVPTDFVWAAVAKSELRNIKKERWDLSFTKTTENPALPNYMSVMSEFADVTDAILKTNIPTLLADPAIQPYFRSLSITDQPRIQPDGPGAPREKHLLLSLSVPSNPEACLNLITGLFQAIDSLPKISLRPETRTKLKKARENVEKELKEAGLKERKEEAAEDKRAAKRKAEEERVSKLSAAEQQKYLDKERKKEMRKSQGKMTKK